MKADARSAIVNAEVYAGLPHLLGSLVLGVLKGAVRSLE
jgi:hypothetical protein